MRRGEAGARTALPPCSAQTATVAHAAWGSGRTHGPAAMPSSDRHSRTCGAGEVGARTALRPCSAQTAIVAHAAQGSGRTHGTAAMPSSDCHSRTCGAGERSHARPVAMLSPDCHSRTCGVGKRSHARHCGHAQLRPPQSHLRRGEAGARTALRPWFGVARRGAARRHAATSPAILRVLQSYCCGCRAHAIMAGRSTLL